MRGSPTGTGLGQRQRAARTSLASLDAMAHLAQHARCVAHVVVAREPGVVEHAREAGRRAGVQVSADLMPFTIRVRFDGRPGDAAC